MKRFLFLSLSILFSLLIILFVPLALFFKPFLPYTNYLLGVDKPITYLILLGNDTEMRANGGFAGSYAKITLSSPPALSREGVRQDGRVEKQKEVSPLLCHLSPEICNLKSDLSFQDIYVPNGQLDGHVTPPEPIQEAFGHGTWGLANADWEPDFPTAATSIRWFLTKGKEVDPDILAIINLSTIKKILDVVGHFYVPEYDATVTPENLYLFLQGKSEVGFFPGSTQKKDALMTVGQALTKKIKTLSILKKLKIAKLLYADLENQNIVLNSTNLSFQNFLNQKNFSGVLKPAAFDTYSLIETNLGANKANAYVTRQTTHQITLSPPALSREGVRQDGRVENTLHHQVTVTFRNSSPEANPNPPFHYGGNYIAYLRLYIPTTAQNISLETATSSSIIANPVGANHDSPVSSPCHSRPDRESIQITSNVKCTIIPHYGLTEIGFWHITTAGTSSTINLSYDLPLPKITNDKCETKNVKCEIPYSLAILKQHGLVTSPQEINIFDKSCSSPLFQNFFFP